MTPWLYTDKNFVVDGVNRLSTIATVLGGYDQSLLKKVKESDSRLKRRVELSSLMHDLSVQVLFIFRLIGHYLRQTLLKSLLM